MGQEMSLLRRGEVFLEYSGGYIAMRKNAMVMYGAAACLIMREVYCDILIMLLNTILKKTLSGS